MRIAFVRLRNFGDEIASPSTLCPSSPLTGRCGYFNESERFMKEYAQEAMGLAPGDIVGRTSHRGAGIGDGGRCVHMDLTLLVTSHIKSASHLSVEGDSVDMGFRSFRVEG